MENTIDLRNCKPGDKLVSSLGEILTYIKPLPNSDYMDHEIRYANGSPGTRTHDGFVFKKNRKDTDHNIVKIIPQESKTLFVNQEVRALLRETLYKYQLDNSFILEDWIEENM